MKIIKIISVILLFCSCQEKKKEIIPQIENEVIEKIETKNEVVITVNDSIKSFFTNLFVDDMQDMPDMVNLGQGEAVTSITIPTNKSIRIAGGEPAISFFYQLELKKGDSLLIGVKKIQINETEHVDYPNFEIPNSDRNWSEINFDYLHFKYNIENKAIVIDSRRNFTNNKFNTEKIYKYAIKLLDSLKEKNSISNDFYEANLLNQKIKFATAKVRQARNEQEKIVVEDLDVKLSDETLLANKEYISFLRTIVLYKYFKKEKRVSNSIQFDYVADNETFLNKNTKQALLDSYLKSVFFVEKPKFEKYLTKFNEINTNKELKSKWIRIATEEKLNKEKLNNTHSRVGDLTNLVNDNKQTFREVLNNHKGKIVLVDFWASWCSPCRQEMPYLKDLKSQFDKTEFKIIEISIDKDYAAWVRASTLENLVNDEDNYIITNWEKSSLYKNYNIKMIPRYLLFGKDGKIIDANAPRPSQKELVELINTSM